MTMLISLSLNVLLCDKDIHKCFIRKMHNKHTISRTFILLTFILVEKSLFMNITFAHILFAACLLLILLYLGYL